MNEAEIMKVLECAFLYQTTDVRTYKGIPIEEFSKSVFDLINRKNAEIDNKDALIAEYDDRLKDCQNELNIFKKLLSKAEAKMKAMQMDKEQLESDIANERMNLNHLQEQIAEMMVKRGQYPYIVDFPFGAICAEDHEGYEFILKCISSAAVIEVLEELKNTLIINNEGNTEIFDYSYTLETIDEVIKTKGVIFDE